MAKTIDAVMLKTIFLAGTKRLESKQEWINELNVFPVPDGDTGTNMTLTLMNAVKELQAAEEDASLEEVGKRISSGTLRGARGNSGVIMSQLCRGFAKKIEGLETLDAPAIAEAFDHAVTTAYKAVMKPKEGTILTVSKAVYIKADELKDAQLELDEYFEQILQYANFILEQTPEMLPVLKEAGVVDSGGQGLVEFLAGAFDAFSGKEVDISFSHMQKPAASDRTVDTTSIETSDIKFGYCTEFIVDLERELPDTEVEAFKAFLNSIGDSIVCVNMEDVMKVHVHTNHPGEALEKALTYGSLSNMKIDNMRLEHNEKVIKEADKALAAEQESKTAFEVPKEVSEQFHAASRKEVGFVAVCAGDGLTQIFKGMSVDEVIEGGQTMNPSTEDILKAISMVDADHVFVLPNNGNIVMAAQQAAALCEDKEAIVIPTKTVAQGINAVINYVPALSIEDNTQQLTEAAQEIKTAEVTHAVRDTEIEGNIINTGDFMGIADGHMAAVGKDLKDVVIRTVQAMLDDISELVTLYFGEDVAQEHAEDIAEALEEVLEDTDVDVEITYGGQPVYYFIISVE